MIISSCPKETCQGFQVTLDSLTVPRLLQIGEVGSQPCPDAPQMPSKPALPQHNSCSTHIIQGSQIVTLSKNQKLVTCV